MIFHRTILIFLGVMLLSIQSAWAQNNISVTSELGHSALLKNKKQKAYLKVRLQGEELDRSEQRPPVNIAIVIDKSGSMSGEKIARAKEAAVMAVNRLAADDIVSIITYDNRVNTVWPASRVGDSELIKDRIQELRAGGSTALYAGVMQGIREVRRHLNNSNVNRIILISDGLANIGPRSPEELGELGQEAAQEGIAVTTIGLGLGYNEDLMAKLAFNSDGNHAFVENASDLVEVFNHEFGDVLSVIAQDVEVDIILDDRIKPLRSLGRKAQIDKQTVKFRLNQMYGSQRKELLLEVETPENIDAAEVKMADIKVRWLNMVKKKVEKAQKRVKAKIVQNESEWKASANKKVMTSVATQIAVEENERAVKLRDKGDIKKAREVLRNNFTYLKDLGAKYGSKALTDLAERNAEDAENLDREKWIGRRKMMRAIQHKEKTQQSY